MTFRELSIAFHIPIKLIQQIAEAGIIAPTRQHSIDDWECSNEDKKYLSFAKQALKLDFTLNEIAMIVDAARNGNKPCNHVRDLLLVKLESTKAQLRKDLMLFERLDKALLLDEEGDYEDESHYSVCKIIEHWAEIDCE